MKIKVKTNKTKRLENVPFGTIFWFKNRLWIVCDKISLPNEVLCISLSNGEARYFEGLIKVSLARVKVVDDI